MNTDPYPSRPRPVYTAPAAAASPIAASEVMATFEELLRALVEKHTKGLDWRQHIWPPGTNTTVLKLALNPSGQLPAWRMVHTLLKQLGAAESSYPAFHAAYERAKLYRPWSDTIRIPQSDELSGSYVIQNTGGTIYLQSERRAPRRTERAVEPVIQDAPGFDLKPDPFTARSITELEELVRDFWRWADSPSSREVAERSSGAFSHATVAKILYDKPNKPRLTMRYLIGLIRGCGGDKDEQQRWATAWRLLDRGVTIPRPAKVHEWPAWGSTQMG
ncbi:hypothetical protein [Nonomuraea rhodomycinica]|uniref:Uncharacterized protein n=1 Tax=Nonomuraea rhodomycinica TaxID=1712872 RepID=A0A7Y6IM36_9ACTN|nr:hypothetical protein [Nonomuraea rhodomycinica]NUW39429.1 hypothetical protein [Nonomuraea rhodomycinica]